MGQLVTMGSLRLPVGPDLARKQAAETRSTRQNSATAGARKPGARGPFPSGRLGGNVLNGRQPLSTCSNPRASQPLTTRDFSSAVRSRDTTQFASNSTAACCRTSPRSRQIARPIESRYRRRWSSSTDDSKHCGAGGSRSTTNPVTPSRTNAAPVRTPTVGQPASIISWSARGPWSSSAR